MFTVFTGTGNVESYENYENYDDYDNYYKIFFKNPSGSHDLQCEFSGDFAEFAEFAEFGAFKHVIALFAQAWTTMYSKKSKFEDEDEKEEEDDSGCIYSLG